MPLSIAKLAVQTLLLFSVTPLVGWATLQEPTLQPTVTPPASPTKASTSEKSDTTFLRVTRQGKKPISLDIANTTYVSESGVQVDLIGAVHIGEKGYYDQLNNLFDRYDVVLYELVAPEGTVIPKGGKREGPGNPLSFMQESMQSLLGLESQLVQIDYTKKHFVRADMTPAQIGARMKERGDTPFTVALSAFADILREQNKLNEQADASQSQANAMEEFGLFELLREPVKMKQMMAAQFVATGSLDQSLGKTLNQLLIIDRNAEALKGLNRQIAAGKKKIGIFYGAAHMPDFEKHLIADLGFRKTEQTWLLAWDLQRGRQTPSSSPLQFLETLLEGPE